MNNFEILKEYEEHKEPIPNYMKWCQQKELEKVDNYLINILMTQNTQLKELLKRCKDFIKYEVPDHCIDDVLIDKIDEVLNNNNIKI